MEKAVARPTIHQLLKNIITGLNILRMELGGSGRLGSICKDVYIQYADDISLLDMHRSWNLSCRSVDKTYNDKSLMYSHCSKLRTQFAI